MTEANQNFFYAFLVSYKGTGFQGWQIQKTGVPTIQGAIHKVLREICKSDQIKTQGAGRTDTGVHALGQVFKATLPRFIEPGGLVKGMNALLPDAIRILEGRVCEESFKPIQDAFWKEYQYYFTSQDQITPFMTDLIAPCSFRVDKQLMQSACETFVGTYDFCNYFCVGTLVSHTRRTIFACELSEVEAGPFAGTAANPIYRIRVVGSGFLKQMVRLMVGAIWGVGRGKIPLKELELSLLQQLPRKLGAVAPPQGLYLKEVNYAQSWDQHSLSSEA